jgi:hypothetical protein
MSRNVYTPDFEAAWTHYPVRVAKAAAFVEWKRAIAELQGRAMTLPCEPSAWLVERVKAFSESPKGRSQYCPHLRTWLHQARYDDDDSAWDIRGVDYGRLSGEVFGDED